MKTPTRAGHAALATLLLCAAYTPYRDFARFRSGINDFLLRYTEARMAGTDHM
jgi:hypothetical protein